MTYSKIPYEWFEYRNKFGRYITYWGDIYSGTLWECPNYDEGFFIIPNYHINEVISLDEKSRTPEKYRELGWEINDYRIIFHLYNVNPQLKEFNNTPPPSKSISDKYFRDMFIFGAGASANCCFGEHKKRFENDPWRPPLGYDIFNERFESFYQNYEGVKIAIPEFELKNNTIEECLEADWERYRKSYMPELAYRHINIQFYLQRLFRHISEHVVENYFRNNLYQIFASRLLNSTAKDAKYRPVIVNFNYDTILDQFIDKTFRYDTQHIDDYKNWEKRSVVHFKPHGSYNWGWRFPKATIDKAGNNIAIWLYENKITPAQLFYELLGEYRKMVNECSYGYEKEKKSLGKHSLDKLQIQLVKDEPAYPALLLPFKNKDEFVMPYHHQSALSFIVIPKIERLFVIGWKGYEQLFLEKLKNAHGIKEVIIVNPEFEIVKSNLEPYIHTKPKWTHIQDFETFIKKEII